MLPNALPNPLLKKLGFSDTDRVVIIHTDDIGMCQATLTAFADLWDFGLISSAAVMVPCPWFPATAEYCRAHPEVDMGVHLTLNAEFDTYRWAPLSTRSPASGLIDREGYFFRNPDDTRSQAGIEAVQTEVQAQVQRALEAGIDVTHVDMHMLTLAHQKFLMLYGQLASQYRLPAFSLRLDAAGFERLGLNRQAAQMAQGLREQMEAQGVPMLDAMSSLPLDRPEDRIEQAKHAMDKLPAGVTHFIIHPAKDTPELRAIAPDWPSRVADYDAFTSEALRGYIQASGIQVIGYRAIRSLIRS